METNVDPGQQNATMCKQFSNLYANVKLKSFIKSAQITANRLLFWKTTFSNYCLLFNTFSIRLKLNQFNEHQRYYENVQKVVCCKHCSLCFLLYI